MQSTVDRSPANVHVLHVCLKLLHLLRSWIIGVLCTVLSQLISMATPKVDVKRRPSDAHWNTSVKDKTSFVPKSILEHLRLSSYSVSLAASRPGEQYNY
jgi:hypothetical protein